MTKHDVNYLAETIANGLVSPNECDRNMEPANVTDGLFAIARAVHRLAEAVEKLAPDPTTGGGS